MPPEAFGDPTTELTIDGTPYTFSELRMGGHGQLQAFLNRLPAPAIPRQDVSGVADALLPGPDVLDTLDPPDRLALVQKAMQDAGRMVASQLRESRAEAGGWPPQVFSREGLHALTTAEGGPAELLYVMLRQHHPETTRQKAREMADGMRIADFLDVFAVAFPVGGDPDPKAPQPGPGPSPSASSSTGSS